MAAAVYGEHHPYARGAMNESSLDNLHRDLILGWARDHVVPMNAVLIVTGQFDPELVKQHIAFYAEAVSSGRDSPDIAAQPSPSRRFVQGMQAKATPTVRLDVEFVGGKGLDSDYAKRLVLERVLTERLASLRAKQALTYGFSASYVPRVAGGLWSISGEVDATRAAEAGSALATVLADMRRDRETYRSEFVLAREKVLEQLLASTGDSGAIAERLVGLARFDLPMSYYDQLVRQVATLTLSQLHEFLRTELPASHQVFGALGNEAEVTAAIAAAQSVN